MLASLCEAYGWSYKEAMSLTMPQLIMLNHASWVNSERFKLEHDIRNDNSSQQQPRADKPVDEMDTPELMKYFSSALRPNKVEG